MKYFLEVLQLTSTFIEEVVALGSTQFSSRGRTEARSRSSHEPKKDLQISAGLQGSTSITRKSHTCVWPTAFVPSFKNGQTATRQILHGLARRERKVIWEQIFVKAAEESFSVEETHNSVETTKETDFQSGFITETTLDLV